MTREEIVDKLEKIAGFFHARADMAIGDGKMLLLSWYKAAEEARGIIEAQEPRVMTLEEVIEHYSLPPVFPDDLGMQEDYYEDIQPLYFEFLHDNEDPWLVHWRGHSKVARYLDNRRHTYNQKWRCWTSRPTDEQREVTPWQGSSNL